ncbi:toxin-antitoxin system YwqK family antitoxin [Janthinobacterium aquaticum]|uniref:toxin-antitoxin system YwqK family antitoxin n=1 Tax=Janthinobacterium sp. FT58W TaxID=2654254 RepID=UPI0012656384|nr:hypothetical protein [Janthinobacterium sp. FT58W]KAB8042734.1 hypothetical protein GCM43_11760 [Janthinobacterium sp. FT58W]
MKRLCLSLLFASALAHAAPFYTGKPLAHPVIAASQDSGLDLVFIREAAGVALYTCDCSKASVRQQQLDGYGNAVIRAVFYAPLDSAIAPENQTMLVLFRQDGKDGLRAYRHDKNSGKYRYLDGLQPALDRFVAANKNPNAAQAKQALARLAPLDYSVVRGNSGNAHFDAIDHTQGSVVGYFDLQGRSVAAASADAAVYKKAFQKKSELTLTASYTRFGDATSGAAELPNYRLWQVSWEKTPQRYTGSQEGASVIYSLAWDDGAVIERGQYSGGLREGLWQLKGMHEGMARGRFAKGLREGPWHIEEPRQIEDGSYRAGKREGRWTVTNFADEDEVTGFDTYAGGQLNGPSERSMQGKLLARGSYANGTRQGPWISEEGEGNYVDGLRDGPWKLYKKDGVIENVRFIKGKRQGELTQHDAAGALRLREHYQADMLQGERTRYLGDAGKEVLVYIATFEQGQLQGREQAFDETGNEATKVLRMDTLWDKGKKVGLDARYYPDGKPERLAVIGLGQYGQQLVTHLREYAEGGLLVNDIHRCYFTEGGSERNDVCDYHRLNFANGKPQYDYRFQFGQRQEGRSWYANGQVQDELLVDRDKDTSVYNTYFENGQLHCTEPRRGHSKRTVNGQTYLSYASADRDGEALCYHPNGKLASRRSYRQRIAVDCGQQFDDTGKQIFPGPEECPAAKKTPFVFGE